MAQRSTYQTKQKATVLSYMEKHSDAYLTVDEVHAALSDGAKGVGRTTVYRTLEAACAQGAMAKVAGTRGEAARYRSLVEAPSTEGQLCCTRCGRAFPLACDMLNDFAAHVERHHRFAIDRRRTVLYGLCADCQADAKQRAANGASVAPTADSCDRAQRKHGTSNGAEPCA